MTFLYHPHVHYFVDGPRRRLYKYMYICAANKWDVAFGAGFRRFPSRDPLHRGDLVEEIVAEEKGERFWHGANGWLQRPGLPSHRVFR